MKTKKTKSAFISAIIFRIYFLINSIFDGSTFQGIFLLVTVLTGMLIAITFDSIILLVLSFLLPVLVMFLADKFIQNNSDLFYYNR